MSGSVVLCRNAFYLLDRIHSDSFNNALPRVESTLLDVYCRRFTVLSRNKMPV